MGHNLSLETELLIVETAIKSFRLVTIEGQETIRGNLEIQDKVETPGNQMVAQESQVLMAVTKEEATGQINRARLTQGNKVVALQEMLLPVQVVIWMPALMHVFQLKR